MSRKENKTAAQFWDIAKKKRRVEEVDTSKRVVFKLSKDDWEDCRFDYDIKTRQATCRIHGGEFVHGVTLHPPHLFKIEDDILYIQSDGEWEQYIQEGTGRISKDS